MDQAGGCSGDANKRQHLEWLAGWMNFKELVLEWASEEAFGLVQTEGVMWRDSDGMVSLA